MALPTRKRILAYLEKNPAASARELSASIGSTPANIRHHLAELESNDLIARTGRVRGRRGRPMDLYGLSQHSLGNGTDELAALLLAELLADLSEAGQEVRLKALARRLAPEDLVHARLPLAGRLNQAVVHLNRMHYRARWEASRSGPRLIFGNCPYLGVVRSCPDLCRMDQALLVLLLQARLETLSLLEPGADGRRSCSFQVLT